VAIGWISTGADNRPIEQARAVISAANSCQLTTGPPVA